MLRRQGRWNEALALPDDPFEGADLLNEQALSPARPKRGRPQGGELLWAEARLLQERRRILHATFLAEPKEDACELELFCRRGDDAPRLLGEAKEVAGASGATVFGARINSALTAAAES